MTIDSNDPTLDVREAWDTPRIEDYGIVGVTNDITSSGIDAFESSKPKIFGS